MRLVLIAALILSSALPLLSADETPVLRLSEANGLPTARIQELYSLNPEVRAQAAAELRTLFQRAPDLQKAEAAKQHWQEQIAKIKPGVTAYEVQQTLLPAFPPPAPASATAPAPSSPPQGSFGHGRPACEHMIGSGDTAYYFWRLDYFWGVWVYANFMTDVIRPDCPPELRPSTLHADVPVPPNFTGVWTRWYVNGQKYAEEPFTDGKRNGKAIYFHDNGRPSYEQHYANGICSGADVGWYADGTKSYEGQYENGERQGVWTHWWPDGTLSSQETLLHGKRNGRYKSWYENGKPEAESDYADDRLNGMDKYWGEDGELLWSRVYADGVLKP